MEKGEGINELIAEAERSLKTADHMVYITYPLIKEPLLLKKILEELHNSANSIIQAILNYDYLYKRIVLQDTQTNWLTFKERCAPRFNISQAELETLFELISLIEKYRASSMDFVRKDKLVIMSDSLRTASVSLENLKKYLSLMKVLLVKTKNKLAQERPL